MISSNGCQAVLALLLLVSAVVAVDNGQRHLRKRQLLPGLSVTSTSHYTTYPVVTSIQYAETPTSRVTHKCTGAMINDRWLLTAAHCVMFRERQLFQAVVREYNLTAKEAQEEITKFRDTFIASQYDGISQLGDIALILLTSSVNTTGFDKFYLNYDQRWPPNNITCKFIGWGRANDTPTQKNFTVLSRSDCSLMKEDGICVAEGSSKLDERDSGGPLLCVRKCKTYVVGVFSSHLSSVSAGLFTDISRYHSWIQEVIQKESIPIAVSLSSSAPILTCSLALWATQAAISFGYFVKGLF